MQRHIASEMNEKSLLTTNRVKHTYMGYMKAEKDDYIDYLFLGKAVSVLSLRIRVPANTRPCHMMGVFSRTIMPSVYQQRNDINICVYGRD